jgi:hypothetical protein
MSNQPSGADRRSRFTSLYEATYADLLRFAQRRVTYRDGSEATLRIDLQ